LNTYRITHRLAFATLALLTLGGCASRGDDGAASTPTVPEVAPEQRLLAVQSAAGDIDKELSVQPLRDPEVEDLRQLSADAIAARDYKAAADALNQALLIVAEDPGILQERAEVALLQSEFERAETLARRAHDIGARVGPLCRRHWATIEQSRLARGQTDDAASARAQVEACTVAGFERM
jgi:Flp pilus assembly protein TadD